jgi:hypothetical protein
MEKTQMKRLFTAMVLCLVLVSIIAAPAIARPNVAFNTGLAINGSELKGSLNAGFKFVTGGTDALLDASLVGPEATPALTDGMYPFYLNTNPAEKAKLAAYFAAKNWTPDLLAQIEAEINGTAPFFYLEAAGGEYSLVDGFMYALAGQKVTLRINDNYPAGLYTYRGTLTSTAGDFRLQVKLKVY